MRHQVTIKEGVVSIDLADIVDRMDQTTRDELCRQLLAQETLFQAVVDALSTGVYFENWWFSYETMTEMRAKLAPLMPDVIRALVKDLIWQRDCALQEKKRMWDWAYKLYHQWPDDYYRARPQHPEYIPTHHPSEKHVDAVVAGEVAP